METLPGTVKHYFKHSTAQHYFKEFEVALLIVSRIKNHSFLQDMFKDVQYTFLSIH
jgi:hypothetical protein